MTFEAMLDKVKEADGFIAALDQSGGSTPKALRLYGVPDDVSFCLAGRKKIIGGDVRRCSCACCRSQQDDAFSRELFCCCLWAKAYVEGETSMYDKVHEMRTR